MKKILSVAMLGVLGVALTGCGSTAGKKDDVVNVFNLKVEMDPALQTFAKTYTEKTGTKVVVKSVGGGADYGAALKAEFESGNAPDVFVVAGAGDVKIWKDVLLDMKDAKWTGNTDKEFVDETLGTVGMPIGVESYGLICDNTKLKSAGVDYKSVDSLAKLEEAFKKITAKGEVKPVSYTTKETWVTGNHTINILFDGSTKAGFDKYMSGDATGLKMEGFSKLVGLLNENSVGDLSTTDYDTQVANVSSGKAACVHQGNWATGNLEKNGMDLQNLVMMPLTYNETTAGNFPIGVPSYMAINKNGDTEKAMDFLEQLVGSAEGAKFYTEAKMIPAVKMEVELTDPVSKQIMEANNAGKAMPWLFTELPDGFGMNTYGPVFDQFYKTKDAQAFEKAIQDAAAQIKK